MRNYLTILCFLFSFSTVLAQEDIVQQAKYHYQLKDYFSAVYYFDLIYQQDSTQSDLWFDMAQSYRLTNQYQKGVYFYEKVWQFDQGLNYPMALYWLGVSYKNMQQYNLASEYLREFLNTHPNTTDQLYKNALFQLKGAELAKLLQPLDIQISHLDRAVNSNESDFAPFAFDSVLFFSSLVKSDGLNSENFFGHHSKIYKSINRQTAEEFKLLNSSDFHVGNISFNPTADQLFFTKCKSFEGSMRCQIYTSFYMDKMWSKPVLMPSSFNPSNSTNTHPQWAFWNGQEGLFLSSDRPGGKGQLDIWFVSMDNQAINLGNEINSIGNEVTPFYHSVEQVLYFSSDFWPNIGGYDIFQNTWNDRWTKTKNIGLPLNSSHNDLYYTSKIDNPNIGYLTSNRMGSFYISNESCCNDIYAFEKTDDCICKEQDSLVQELQLHLPLQLFFHNDEPDPKSTDSITTISYANAYQSFYQRKSIYVEKFAQVLNGKLKKKAERDMEVFFDSMVKKGMNQLDLFASQLLYAMQLQAKVELNLIGFTSPLTNKLYNQSLSKRRISSVLNYLQMYDNGILLPFLENGRIIINELPMGETRASKEVSDNPNDRRQSVYSINAAYERRIEIQSISIEFLSN